MSSYPTTPTSDDDGQAGRAARRPGRRAVMADVAAAAKVSQMTVSRVINGTGPVRPSTRQRVEAVMRQLDYQPNTAARMLATGRTTVLGVVAHNTTLFGPASTLYAIEQTARRAGYSVIVVTVPELDSASIQEAVDHLRRQSVAGLVVMTPHESAVEAVDDLDIDLPIVTVQGQPRASVPGVVIDQGAGARRATEHLLSLGHHTVSHIAGPSDWIEAQARESAWREVLEEFDRPVPQVRRGDWSARSGYEIGKEILAASAGKPLAVFVANDHMALGLYRAATESGRRLPRDVSIVGFDDIPEAAYFSPPLTTVRQDFSEVGRCSMALLLKQVDDPETLPDGYTVDAEVVLRDSTSAPT